MEDNTGYCDLLRRLISIFIFSMMLFVLLSTTGFCTSPDVTINSTQEQNQNQIQSIIFTQESNIYTRSERNHYTSYDDLCLILKEVAYDHKSIVKLYDDRGTTYEDRIIWMLKISDNPGDNEDDEIEVLYVGAHHGDEAIGNEMALTIIDTFTDGYGKDPRITWLVDNHEIWVVPMPNPDGLEYTLTQESWRKNRSPNYISEVTPNPFDPELVVNSYGTDLNRNYDMEWGDPEGSSIIMQRSPTYAGSEPFSEFETQAIRDLVLAHNFSVYMDYHSGTEMILYPWGYTSDPTPDNVLFERVAKELERLTGVEERQGYELYQTNGDSLDWIYYVSRTLAFTIELSSPKMPEPNTIQPILDNHIKLPLYLTGISGDLETGSKISIISENIVNQTDLGPYKISAKVKGLNKYSDIKIRLYYRINNEDYKIITMKSSDSQPNHFTAEIPTQGPNSMIQYFIVGTNDDILISTPGFSKQFEFSIKASPESIPTQDEIIAMVIMMIIILGFFWGGFGYAARLALLAERRKLHEYYYGED